MDFFKIHRHSVFVGSLSSSALQRPNYLISVFYKSFPTSHLTSSLTSHITNKLWIILKKKSYKIFSLAQRSSVPNKYNITFLLRLQHGPNPVHQLTLQANYTLAHFSKHSLNFYIFMYADSSSCNFLSVYIHLTKFYYPKNDWKGRRGLLEYNTIPSGYITSVFGLWKFS